MTALLLAAGRSRRMGRPKQLLPLNSRPNGTPAIRRCLDTIISSGIEDAVVVLADFPEETKRILNALFGLPFRTAVNGLPGSDMAGSVRAGLREIAMPSCAFSHGQSAWHGLPGAGETGPAVLVFPADQPLVSAGSIRTLLKEHVKNPRNILVPFFEGRRGHPALFPWELIAGVFSGSCLRDIIRDNPGRVGLVETGDIGVVLDMDTPADYRRVLGILERA
ncbi:MAG: nucleotidyltransferase family protein [Nitrospiraceae bacterium]|nr:nucleotidyltransferase family protein [Nitrospiraceae bacterium]